MFGRRSKAGIWNEETRKFLNGVSGALDADIVERNWRKKRNGSVWVLIVMLWD